MRPEGDSVEERDSWLSAGDIPYQVKLEHSGNKIGVGYQTGYHHRTTDRHAKCEQKTNNAIKQRNAETDDNDGSTAAQNQQPARIVVDTWYR